MIQGGGPWRPSLKRHRKLGKLDVKELQLQQWECSLYTSSTLRRENRAQKHINNPHVQGARTQDIQHDSGHPNSPIIHQVRASSLPPIREWSSPSTEPTQTKIKNTQKRKPGRRLTNTTLFSRAPVSVDATYRLGGQKRCPIEVTFPNWRH